VLSGSGLSSMLSVNNMGYNIFDYSLLKSKSEYAREYVRQKLEEARNSGDLSREWMNQEPVVSFLDSKTVTLDWEAFRGRLLPVLRALALPRPELDAERARDLYVWARESLAEFSLIRSRELELLNGTVNELAGDIFINTGLAERNRLVIEGENELRRVYRKYSILFAELRSAEGDAAAADLFTGPVAPQSAGNRPSPGLILEQSI
ncbi:MAG: hypothetical protein PHO30_02395, partial [Candidatus Omnitrophica bacterium]|nr:hypothetical protein [Candidatus Omnitrophota bacterium]